MVIGFCRGARDVYFDGIDRGEKKIKRPTLCTRRKGKKTKTGKKNKKMSHGFHVRTLCTIYTVCCTTGARGRRRRRRRRFLGLAVCVNKIGAARVSDRLKLAASPRTHARICVSPIPSRAVRPAAQKTRTTVYTILYSYNTREDRRQPPPARPIYICIIRSLLCACV